MLLYHIIPCYIIAFLGPARDELRLRLGRASLAAGFHVVQATIIVVTIIVIISYNNNTYSCYSYH